MKLYCCKLNLDLIVSMDCLIRGAWHQHGRHRGGGSADWDGADD
jgi:hypothetical protein